MKQIADLHIHSRYSMATSKDGTPEMLDLWARKKGITLLGTGDMTHPIWRQERALITPHVSGGYQLPETFERIVRIAGGNLEKFLAGEKDSMKNLVDFKTGYRRR